MTENASEKRAAHNGDRAGDKHFRCLAARHLRAVRNNCLYGQNARIYVTASTKAHLIALYSASVSRFKSNDVTAEATENAKNTRKTGMSTALLKTETAFAP